jgi:hypothetical protein
MRRWVLLLSLLLLPTASAMGQQLSSSFLIELVFTPPPLIGVEGELVLSLTVADVTLTSETHFTPTLLEWQRFTLSLAVGALEVEDRLTFEPGFHFSRNELEASLAFGGLGLDLLFILADLGFPGPPDIEPGMVIEIEGETASGLRLASLTGIAVTEIAEDLDNDDVPDRNVTTPFVFTEEVVILGIRAQSLSLESATQFTLTGFTWERLQVELALSEPQVSLLTAVKFDSTWAIIRVKIDLQATMGALSWRSLTVFSGPPLGFELQRFSVILTVFEGLAFLSSTEFDPMGFVEGRLGMEISF